MKANIVAIVGTLLITACSGERDGLRKNEAGFAGRVDSCDLRKITGTCVEYTMSELDDWYRENLARACPSNSRGELTGAYEQNSRCPEENRVARCENIVEDAAERYEYDKHYYTGTAEGYSWESESVQATCEHLSGRFVLE